MTLTEPYDDAAAKSVFPPVSRQPISTSTSNAPPMPPIEGRTNASATHTMDTDMHRKRKAGQRKSSVLAMCRNTK